MRKDIANTYEATIGVECHVQLRTKTKLFSGADNDARDKAPNTAVSPICFGLPGTLPVLNREAVALAIRAGIALNAEIARLSSFDRKHYFYPDLPKGYQITQLERPTVGRGSIQVPLNGQSFTVRITRAHMEEDAGKLTHPAGADYSLVDLNRAGTPLVEIVSEPDMHSPQQAKAYVQELYLLMKYAGVTYGDLYQGNMRFDINISVAPKGSTTLGTRTEIKNLNSFRSVERAAEYEFARQVELLERGERIVQETRGWNDAKQKTVSQRSKEEAMDYRYFPDADLPPIELSNEQIEAVRRDMPLLPPEIRAKFARANLTPEEIETLLLVQAHIDLLVELVDTQSVFVARQVALWFIHGMLSLDGQELAEIDKNTQPIATDKFVALATMVEQKELSANAGKEVFFALLKTGNDPRTIAEQKGLLQRNDQAFIESLVMEVLEDPASASAIASIKAGNDRVLGYLVGQVMKKSQGKANPALVSELIKQKLA